MESENQNTPINTESWEKLSIEDYWIDSQFDKIYWMWDKFPWLKHLEIQNTTYFDPKIFDKILQYNKNRDSLWMRNIKTISNNSDSFSHFDTNVSISRSNLKLGVLIGDKIIACKVAHAKISGDLSQWIKIDSPFGFNKKFLIMWNNDIQFDLKELEIDNDCDKRVQDFYSSPSYQDFDKIPHNSSILFIITIDDISIPDKLDNFLMELNININDFRSIYNLTWSQQEVSKELENYIDTISDQSLIELSVVESTRWINMTSLSRKAKFSSKIKSDKNKELLIKVWKGLLSK